MSNGTVTIINTTPYKEQPVPEVGKEYYTFDDGKIRPSRLSIATISKVIPFAEVNPELLDTWKQNVEECYWLYATETDYFIEAEYDDETVHFIRTTDGGWFSLGWFGARLDIDGSLYNKMIEWYGEDCLRNE
jgi:hypothetical protein